ncbi:MAG: FAD-binding oxidoreductase, partial [Chthoniobacter sp. 12-60-6]
MSAALERLAELLPLGRLLVRPVELAAYESDALTAFRSRPLAVVMPETEDEVIAIVRLCHELRLPFVARGSGTSLSGGSLPIADGIVIALNRLNRILKLDPVHRIAVVQPGVINTQVTT